MSVGSGGNPAWGLKGIQRSSKVAKVVVLAGAGVGAGSLNYANTLYQPLTITAQAERACSLWPNKAERDVRPPLGAAYQRVAPVAPSVPAVPPTHRGHCAISCCRPV